MNVSKRRREAPARWRLAGRFLAHRLRDLHVFEVQAVLLNACNLKCSYCRCPEIRTHLLSTKQWLDVIDRFARVGTLRIKFQGGEPTIRKDFPELCAAVRRHRMLAAAVTNGIEIADHPELLDELDEVIVSLDSLTPVVHDRLRGKGSHAAAIAALDRARERGVRAFVNMVVTRESLPEVEGLLAYCEARDVTMNAQPVVFGTPYYDEGARSQALTKDEIVLLSRRLASWKRAGRGLMFLASSYEKAATWTDHDVISSRTESPSSCMAGRFYVHVEPNGDVHPCVQHVAGFRPMNLVRDGFEESLRAARVHDCGDCFAAYLNERKSLFALRPEALYQIARRGLS